MKRLARVVALLAVAGSGLLFAAAPAAADVEDFSFSRFDVDYFVDRDADGHSTLRTIETLVVQFPEFDQNRGIFRDLPETIEQHIIDVDVQSVTDGDGAPVVYETSSHDDLLSVKIGSGEFVHGEQTYVITYTQREVTIADGRADEWLWNVNGSWSQPIDSLTARVHIPSALAATLTGDTRCLRDGETGDDCTSSLAREQGSGETVFSVTENDLAPYTAVSVAIRFEPGTFVASEGAVTEVGPASPESLVASIWASPYAYAVIVVLALVFIGALVGAVVVFVRR